MTDTLSWSPHIKYIYDSPSRELGFINKKLKNAPISLQLQAYNSLVRSKLEYAIIVWNPFTQNDTWMLKMVQRRAVCFIYRNYKMFDSPSQKMQPNKIQSLQIRKTNFTDEAFFFLLFYNKVGCAYTR